MLGGRIAAEVAVGSFLTPSKIICTMPDGVVDMQFDAWRGRRQPSLPLAVVVLTSCDVLIQIRFSVFTNAGTGMFQAFSPARPVMAPHWAVELSAPLFKLYRQPPRDWPLSVWPNQYMSIMSCTISR